MRRPMAVVGLAMLAAAGVVSCSDQRVAPVAPSLTAPDSPLMDAAADHNGSIIGHDSCDPASFNAGLNNPVACQKPGRTTFQEFLAELTATHTVQSWRFNPEQATVHSGENMSARNVGGEDHTFTPVKKFGGGFIGILNTLSNNPVPAPECANPATLDFVSSGEASLISAGALAAATDANGIARVQCCIHPWMRAEVRVK